MTISFIASRDVQGCLIDSVAAVVDVRSIVTRRSRSLNLKFNSGKISIYTHTKASYLFQFQYHFIWIRLQNSISLGSLTCDWPEGKMFGLYLFLFRFLEQTNQLIPRYPSPWNFHWTLSWLTSWPPTPCLEFLSRFPPSCLWCCQEGQDTYCPHEGSDQSQL